MTSSPGAGGSMRLAESIWDGAPVDELAMRWGVPRVEAFTQIESTNDRARELLELGAESGTVVVADRQTEGRGRRGRAWESATGGLWMSVLLGCDSVPQVLPLRVGLGLARTLELLAPRASVQIKWPNDAVLDGRKIGGILCEAVPGGVVVGLGVNVGQQSFSAELEDRATSLRLATGSNPGRRVVAGLVLDHRAMWPGPGELTSSELTRLEGLDAFRGRHVRADVGVTGMGRRPLANGSYCVETESGQTVSVHAGSIQLEDSPS